MTNKYLVIVDLSTRMYSVEYTLLHVANSKAAAAAWIRKHPIVKTSDGCSDVDLRKAFEKGLWVFDRYARPKWENDDDLAKMFIKEFTGEPLIVGSYEE